MRQAFYERGEKNGALDCDSCKNDTACVGGNAGTVIAFEKIADPKGYQD
jgi:hypothetical protein